MTPVDEEFATPLLPVPNTTAKRGSSPNPSTREKMWSGDPNKLTPVIPGVGGTSTAKSSSRDKDLTNTKLAKNQYVLLEQIESLRQTLETQGEMLSVLMTALAEKNGMDMPTPKSKGKERAKEEDESPLSLGESDDEH